MGNYGVAMRYQVDSEQVLTAAQQASNTIARIQSDVQALNAHLNHLSASWSGPAHAAFSAVHSQWHQTQLRVEETLQRLSESLAMAGRHYQDLEAGNARLFQP